MRYWTRYSTRFKYATCTEVLCCRQFIFIVGAGKGIMKDYTKNFKTDFAVFSV